MLPSGRRLLIEISTKLDLALKQQADHELRLRAVEARPQLDTRDLLDKEARLRALERTKWLALGAATAAGGLAGKIVGLL